ncbi:MAG: MATE family efflux transporter, partial [Shimia sp.]
MLSSLSMREAKGLARLAVPIMVSMAAATSIMVVDTLMVAPLGTVPLAVIALASTILVVVYAALYGLVSVTSILSAQALGAGTPKRVGDIMAAGLWLGLAGALLTVMALILGRPLLAYLGQPEEVLAELPGYWNALSLSLIPFAMSFALKGGYEGIDRAWLATGFAFLSVLINIPTNYIFIYVLGFGVTGAGLASLVSEAAGLAILVAHWRLAKSMAPYRTEFRLSLPDIRQQLKDGVAIAGGYAGEGAAYAVAGLMMGWFGAVALAAFQIVNAVGSILYMVPLGMAAAVSIKIGQAEGAAAKERLRPIAT